MKIPKLIFSDVDNTLVLSERGFTDLMKEAFKVCEENNIEFVMCSGRPTANLIIEAKLLKESGINLNYVAGCNASELYDLNKNEIVYRYGFDQVQVKEITDIITNLGYNYLFYDDKIIKASDITNKWVKHEFSITKLDELIQAETFNDTAKVLGICNPGEGPKAVLELQERLPWCTITLSTDFFIEITQKGVDKGFGLIKTSEMLKIAQEDVTCFGDGGNDLGMFKTHAYSIAVDNAIDSIKENADEIIDSAANDGVAKYIISNYKK